MNRTPFIALALLVPLLLAGTTNRPGGSSTSSPVFSVDGDASGVEPPDGSGYCIGAGAGRVCFLWDAPNNQVDLIGPAGTTLGLPDPGDGSRGTTLQDNTSALAAPAAGFTALYSMFGNLFARTNGGPSARIPMVLDKDVAAFTLNGDGEGTTETTVYAFSVPAGIMGATGTLRVTAGGTYTTGAATARVAVRIKLGASTLWGDDGSDTSFTDQTVKPWNLTFTIQNLTASSQVLSGFFHFGRNNGATFPITGTGMIVAPGSGMEQAFAIRGTSAIDTTSAETLSITGQLGGTSPTNAAVIFVVDTVVLEAL